MTDHDKHVNISIDAVTHVRNYALAYSDVLNRSPVLITLDIVLVKILRGISTNSRTI
jgi:hypothetical protein